MNQQARVRRAFQGWLLLGLVTAGPGFAQTVKPPEVTTSPAALYPAGHLDAATVATLVTVDVEGSVTTAEIAQSAGADFDAAALAAVRQWKFHPATREGVPFAARIRIPFRFEPPLPVLADGGVTAPPQPTVTALPSPRLPEEDGDAGTDLRGIEEVNVRGHQKRADRGGSDFQIEVGKLATVVNSPSDLLQLAPGIFIANEGGEGHADQVFLRGFNAEQGQSIEFTVGGVPINEVDNSDGHGYADTHFVIPETVKNLRVIEGPFDPHQGDFAEAGSAEYELGVTERGVRLEGWYGSFQSRRLMALYAPQGEREGTFAAAQFWQSSGFGSNRANGSASLMGQYEGVLGDRGLWRLLATSYANHYRDAGVVRADDFRSGRVDFYGSEPANTNLGGDAQRHSLSFDLENPTPNGDLVRQQMFLTFRTLRILENFTGFLEDEQRAGQSTHPQRGDAILQSYQAITAGARGSYRATTRLLGREQALEIGYYGRYDHTVPEVNRVRSGTQLPYAVDQAFTTDIFNIAAFLDVDLHPLAWLTVRGGVRQELFSYNVLNRCDTAGTFRPGRPLDVGCPAYDRSGPRLPEQRITAAGTATLPKATLIAKLRPDVSLTASYGVGAQSLDARYISQDAQAPVAKLNAVEGGAIYHRVLGQVDLSGRVIGYSTHVSQDLIFNPALGRLTAANGATRSGVVAAARATSRWFDESASVTYAHAVFDKSAEQPTVTLVPYVPTVIARSDSAVFGPLPRVRILDRPIVGTVGLGVNYIGVRPLPFSQAAAPTLELDASANLRWNPFQLGVRVTNLTDARYPSSQFFYASNFQTRNYPTLTPVEHFTAAAPRTVLFTLTVYLDQESSR